MRSRAFIAVFAIGCGGDCIPKEAVTAASFPINVAPTVDVHIVNSAAEFRSMLGNARVSFPTPPRVAGQEADTNELVAHERLVQFVEGTNFTTTDLALVRAGGARSVLRGVTTNKNGPTTLYYAGTCSPCGGGNPGSYEDARASEEAARAERTELVRVPKGSHVVVKECSTECGTCPTNVP